MKRVLIISIFVLMSVGLMVIVSASNNVYAQTPTPTSTITPTPTPQVFLVQYPLSLTAYHNAGVWHGADVNASVTFPLIDTAKAKGFIAKSSGTCFSYGGGLTVRQTDLAAHTHWQPSTFGKGVSELVYNYEQHFAGLEELQNYPAQRFFTLTEAGSSLFNDSYDYTGETWNFTFFAEASSSTPNCSVTVDGVYLVYYGIPPLETEIKNCWDYFQIGQEVVTDTVKPYNDELVDPLLWEGEKGKAVPGIEGGKWYALEVVYPYWMDGTGQSEWFPSYKAELSPFWSLAGAVEWYELSQYPNGCWQPLGDYGQGRLFFYADEQISDYLTGIRAYNEYGDYFDNLGLMHYKVNEAIYNPPPAACEANFDIGDFVNTIRVPAWYSDGLPVFANSSPIPNTTYVIDISSEPWFDEEGKPQHGVDISLDGGQTWVNIRDRHDECEAEKGIGGYKYYFKYVAGRNYRIRASDGNEPLEYLGNKGYVKFSVYTATSYKAEGACSQSFTLGNVLKTGSIPANISGGDLIQYNLTPDNWYAIEIVPPAWSNAGVESKEADISGGDSGWQTFYPLADFPGVACAEENDGYKRIYFRAQYSQYLLRAHEDVLQYEDNSGSVNYKLYGVEVSASNPPPGSCESAYNTNRIVVSLPILYANLENGIELKLAPGKYMLETMEGPWMNEATPSYDVEITSGGLLGTYVPINSQGVADPLECVVPLSDGLHYRAYFSVEAGKYYRVRVYDPEGTFATNTGQMVIAIYRVSDINEPPPDPADYTVNGCNSICLRPDSILDVPEWIEYNRCAFSKWISFCPYHAESLMSVLVEFNNREPFGTLLQFTSLPQKIQEEFNQYRWADAQGGDGAEVLGGGMQPWEILAQLPSSSPFNNGRIDIVKPMTPFSTFCQNEMTKAVGTKLSAPMCFALNVLNGLGVNKWINTIFNLVLAGVFFMYIYNAWIKQFGN